MTITAKIIKGRSLIFLIVWFNSLLKTPSKMPLKPTEKRFRGDSS
jgi:hypothetical protein